MNLDFIKDANFLEKIGAGMSSLATGIVYIHIGNRQEINKESLTRL